MAELPGAVLFACNFNRVRSAMAEALMKRAFGTAVYVDSCGLRPQDEHEPPDPFVEAVMGEIGVEIASHRSKTFDDLTDGSFDVVISLTPETHHHAVELGRNRSTEVEYWPTPDPTLQEGSREARLAAYRAVRDELSEKILQRFGGESTVSA
ncbi:MAG: low molecular weight phosphatase family protein [Caulobacteraceae bacterium]|nr:low molecular weight phosphatase family protein [Caulobacteraceae bacterium]